MDLKKHTNTHWELVIRTGFVCADPATELDTGSEVEHHNYQTSYPVWPQKPQETTLWQQVEPKQSGWGWLSCTQGNVMTKQQVPQFSGGHGTLPHRGASLHCRSVLCHANTVLIHPIHSECSVTFSQLVVKYAVYILQCLCIFTIHFTSLF